MQIGKRFFSTVLVLSLAFGITSCGTTPTKPESKNINLTLEQLPSYLEENDNLSAEEINDRKLNAIEFLISKGEIDWAHSLADQLDLSSPSEEFFIRYQLALGQIAIREGEPYLAQRYLFDKRISSEKLNTYPELGAKLLDISATLQFDLAEYLSAVDFRLQLDNLLLEDELSRQLNHDLIWEALSELPANQLFALSREETEEVKQGWLSLAALSKNNGANFRKQIQDIRQWRQVWPEHPANQLLPADLQLILQLSDQQSIHIALMLPLSGKLGAAGQAIKDGFLAGFYDDASIAIELPKLSFYDTVNNDINSLYERAKTDQVQLIIGPLLKENVTKLSTQDTLEIPTLALNTISFSPQTEVDESISQEAVEEKRDEREDLNDLSERHHSTLFQFTLAVESEAKQVAVKAWKDGHRRAMIIAPASAWGDRSVSAFEQEWVELGGELIDDRRFKDQRSYSALIESSVAVDTSKRRKRQLQQLLGKKLEFEPRSRKDIDFIFMPSYSSQAKQLKPLLAFHYAGEIPVYAMSQVYTGKNTQNLSDLNGIRFSALPWYFEEDAEEKRAIIAYSENQSSLQHFYAMGVDAYHIYPRLQQLQQIQQASFYGYTGKLRVAEGNIITREQTWAEIRNGMAIETKNTASESSHR